jgi:preprotein translocase subunit SecE
MRRLQKKEEERAKKRRSDGPRKRERSSFRQFLREVRQELKKVAWPTREETTTFTVVVIIVTVVLTGITFGMDVVFKRGVLFILDAV